MSLMLDERRRAMLAEMGIVTYAALHEEEPTLEPAQALAASGAAASMDAPPLHVLADEPAPAAAPARVAPRAVATSSPGELELLEWDALARAFGSASPGGLCITRHVLPLASGEMQPDFFVVGEPPDDNADAGPFAGPPGDLLDNMLRTLGVARGHKVFIANLGKCRPQGDRNGEPAAVAQGEPVLRRQIELLQPKVILAMGRFAVQSLLATDEPIGKLRGRALDHRGTPVVVTYHPAYLLRNLPDKAKAWADLCLANALLAQGQAGAPSPNRAD